MKDTVKSIRHSAMRFFSGTALSRISGMLRDVSMAYAFGTQPAIAIFMVAFRFAHLLRRLFGEGALQSAFIPTFESLRKQDPERAAIFFRTLTLSLTLFLIFVILASAFILACSLYLVEWSAETYELLYLTLLLLPSLLFICLYGLNASFLHCQKNFFVPSVAPVAFNAIWIVSVMLLRTMPSQQAMRWLTLGILIACACQWLLTVPQTWKLLKKLSVTIKVHWQTALMDLHLLTKPLFLGIIGVAASQVNNAVDAIFARFADPEGPALLWYAIRVQQLPLALFGVAIAGAILPPLSRALKDGNLEEFYQFLDYGFYRTWSFIFPLVALIYVLGDICIALLYGRGDFGVQSTIGTTHCLWAYTIGLLPSALVLILAPASYAQGNYRLPALVSLYSMILNVFLNALFILFLGWGAISVAIATSISAWFNVFILGYYLLQQHSQYAFYSLIKRLIKNSIVSLAAAGSIYTVRMLGSQYQFFDNFRLLSVSFWWQFIFLVIMTTLFGVIFFVYSQVCSIVLLIYRRIIGSAQNSDYKLDAS